MKKIFLPILLIFIFSCSSDNGKKVYDEGLKFYNEKKYSEALEKFNELINEYSSGEFREKSLMLIGSMYYMYLIPNVDQNESNKKAVDYFRILIKEYPNSKDSPKAAFLVGYILANHLNKLDEAKLAYQFFLDNYPENELAKSIKLELENLGKSPEEILQNKISKSK
ncbi:MAG: tetratricopeptide repeat protein [Melioribacteraceae bacterium]|nr:tetratricopeptide repeat protein [Melioribacteraceae bacterium]